MEWKHTLPSRITVYHAQTLARYCFCLLSSVSSRASDEGPESAVLEVRGGVRPGKYRSPANSRWRVNSAAYLVHMLSALLTFTVQAGTSAKADDATVLSSPWLPPALNRSFIPQIQMAIQNKELPQEPILVVACRWRECNFCSTGLPTVGAPHFSYLAIEFIFTH